MFNGPGGRYSGAAAASFGGVEPCMDPVPAVGEHTEAILAGLGCGAAEIAELRMVGVV